MTPQALHQDALFWALEGVCALHRKPFSVELAQQQLAEKLALRHAAEITAYTVKHGFYTPA